MEWVAGSAGPWNAAAGGRRQGKWPAIQAGTSDTIAVKRGTAGVKAEDIGRDRGRRMGAAVERRRAPPWFAAA